MELIDNFDQALWNKGDASQQSGLTPYRVVKGTAGKGKGEFSYAICDQEGNMMKVNLHGAGGKKDPLTGIRNAELKLSADNSEIIVINVDDDCVVKK